ncbi:MAG: DUF2029 domain-containing protein [Candidatus Wallbacteria bacterium]|nr:DUF2029 domain-containing protein [Candidatus Wallbacteria bacterium]
MPSDKLETNGSGEPCLRHAWPLAICCAALLLLVCYLGHAAVKGGSYLPGEEAVVGALGRMLFAGKPRYDGSLASVARQDVLIVQTGLFFFLGSLIWAAAVRAAFTSRLPNRAVVGAILGGAVLLRAVAVPAIPVLETDHHRYVWDGAVTWAGLNPFQFAPVEVANWAKGKNREMYPPVEQERLERLARLAATPELEDHVRRINHPNIPTLYPPAAQAMFAAASAIAPGSVTALKVLVATADLGVCVLLGLLLARLGRDPRWIVAYAWCPLVLKEYAATGHYDPLAVAGTLAALLLALRGKGVAAGAALAGAALSKLYPLLLLPVFARRLRGAGLAAFFAILFLGYLPFLRIGLRAFDGLVAFGTSWEFNSGLFAAGEAALKPLVDRKDPVLFSFIVSRKASQDYLFFTEQTLDAFLCTKLLAALALGLVIVLTARKDGGGEAGFVARCGAIMAALFFLSPVADPWYFGWVAPFACVFPSAAAAWLAWSMSLYYFYFLTWSYPSWTRPLEYLPCCALLLLDLSRWNPNKTGWGCTGNPGHASLE